MVIKDSDFKMNEKTGLGVTPKPHSHLHAVASPVDRLAATVIDYAIILSPIAILMVSPLQRYIREGQLIQNPYPVEAAKALAFIAVILLVLLYQTLFTWLWNATPGKLLLGLKIQSDAEEKNISFMRAFMRASVWMISLFLSGLPFLSVFSHTRRRTLHDRVSETVVCSVRPSRAGGRPKFAEFAVARGIYWAVGALLFVSFLYYLGSMFEGLKDKQAFISELESNDELCAAVSESLADWGGETNDSTRLDAAMSLYGAGSVDLNCLAQEVEKLFTPEDSFPLLNMARAFVYSDNVEASDGYLSSLCEDNHNSVECIFSRFILTNEEQLGALQEDDALEEKMSTDEILIEEVDEVLSLLELQGNDKKTEDVDLSQMSEKLLESEFVYPHVWAVKEFARREQFDLAQKHLEKIPNIPSLSSFVMANQTKIFWANGEEDRAVGAESVAYSSMDTLTAIQLSSYMCLEKLWQNCTATESLSCRKFDEIVGGYDDVLSYSRASLVYLKQKECLEGASTKTYERVMAKPINDDVRRLVDILMESGTDGFTDFAQSFSNSKLIETEAHLRLIERTQSLSMLKALHMDWQAMDVSSNWKKVGQALFQRLRYLSQESEALSVAEELVQRTNERVDRRLLEDAIRIAYNNKQFDRSQKFMQTYIKRFPIMSETKDSREPASAQNILDIYKDLLTTSRESKAGP